MKVNFCFILIFMFSCNNQRSGIEKKRVNDKIIESNFINDSIFDGVTKYYDLNEHIESKIDYSNGLKNGLAINYYSNGKLHDSSFYKNGLANGFHFVFDSLGSLIYTDYYFGGRQIGGQVFYKNQRPFQYIFKNFERQNIYSCGYDSIGMNGYSGELLNVNLYSLKSNDVQKLGLFVYLISPPTTHVKYTLVINSEKTNEQKAIASFNNNAMFADTVLSLLPNGHKYYLSVDFNDSSNKIKKTYFNELKWTLNN